MRHLVFTLLLGLGVSSVAFTADFTPEEQAVWQMEEAYWRYVQAGDVENYVTLWHDRFVGWPCFSATPSDKSKIGGWVQEIRDGKLKFTYELKPLAVRVFGDVAIVQYAAVYVTHYPDGTATGAGLWRKFTHTWQKIDGRWQIITGMCAAQEPLQTPRL